MSGFETTWLDLREPADARARDGGLLAEAIAYLETRTRPVCVDLGCGTGSTARAFAAEGSRPVWRLVDDDPALLREAERRLPHRSIETRQRDIGEIDDLDLAGAALVTASALFDLCSSRFVADLAKRLTAEGVGLYAALSYDGTMTWEEALALDGEVVAAFNDHQQGDKGMGPALGPEAGRALARTFERHGFSVRTAASPWRLTVADDALYRSFIAGVVDAVGETGRIAPSALDEWRRERLSRGAEGCVVGHVDVLALPLIT